MLSEQTPFLVIAFFVVTVVACAPNESARTRSALADAIRSGDLARVRTFTAAERVEALGRAAQNGDEFGVKTLLAAGTDPQSGMFPAVLMGNTKNRARTTRRRRRSSGSRVPFGRLRPMCRTTRQPWQ